MRRSFPRPVAALAGAVAMAAFLSACQGGDERAADEATPGATETGRAAGAAEFPDWPNTDFSKLTVDLSEVLRGCPARDCIPALDAEGAVEIPSPRGGAARFAPASELTYAARLPVAVVTVGGITRGYPLHVLTWHEVVNDRFGEVPVVVTFCPLCNTAISFDRRVEGRTLDFGVSGNLRNSDLIMWDRQTESWWQQAIGEGIAGEFAGSRLTPIPTSIVSFGDFAASFPGAPVLTEDTGFGRTYGVNPYEGYDSSSSPFLFTGKADPRLPALDRVLTLDRAGKGVAIPLATLARTGVANLVAGGDRVVAFWAPGTASALGATDIANARDVGSAVAYRATAEGRDLTFRAGDAGATFVDDQTGSTWNIFGLAISGPLAGAQLEPVFHTTEFWFAWAAFHPETTIWDAESTSRRPSPPAERVTALLRRSNEPEFCWIGGMMMHPCWAAWTAEDEANGRAP